VSRAKAASGGNSRRRKLKCIWYNWGAYGGEFVKRCAGSLESAEIPHLSQRERWTVQPPGGNSDAAPNR
jgi:hypothetical protein